MKRPALQSALREWRAHMAQPVRAAALVGVALILAIIGPFGTAEAMRPLPRLIYWATVTGLGYSAGYAANRLADRLAPQALLTRIGVAGGMTGLLAFIIVYLTNGLALGYWPGGMALAVLAGNVFGIAAIISAIFQLAYSPGQAMPPAGPPPILDRVPLDKRAALVALSVEDHYVRIRTTKGEQMVLMRLADAIREVGGTPGLRVHRAHWVALAHVASVMRKGDGAILHMTCGADIPVSRANMAAIREAGLLPR